MSLNLVSPGVKVREVDLTVGRIDAVNEQVGVIAGPFQKGPVSVPTLIETEQDLLNTFGKPLDNDGQYEYWLSASSYLSYGGTLRVIRSDGSQLINAHSPTSAPLNLKITNDEDYQNNQSNPTGWTWAAKNPGSWGNGLKVCTIDSLADQRIGMGTFGISVGFAVTCGLSTVSYVTTSGSVTEFSGYIKGIVTKVNVGSVDVKIVSNYDYTNLDNPEQLITYSSNPKNSFPVPTSSNFTFIQVFNSVGTATSLEKFRLSSSATIGIGSTVISVPDSTEVGPISVGDLIGSLNGSFSARVVGVNTGQIVVSSASPVSFASTSMVITFSRGVSDGTSTNNPTTGEGLLLSEFNVVSDWYNQQTLNLDNSVIFWKNIAPKPSSSQYSTERNSTNDEIHIAVVDDSGSISGVSGNILEKFTNLSKSLDARINPSENIYYKDYIANNSSYIVAGEVDVLTPTSFTTLGGYTPRSGASITWGQNTSTVQFGCVGQKTYSLLSGFDYSSSTGGMVATLSNVLSSYELVRNPAEYNVNFLITGPSGGNTILDAQAKANSLIALAEERKDCVVTISPFRGGVVNVTNTNTQTSNIINFFDALSSSSYAVFDSGYKYVFDRFNNTFRYIPLNADIAGLMARTSINNYAWFSPAGSSRGTINNAVKLAYNPSQGQRDLLYPKRINPVIFSPGAGIILFGDKTGLSYASAFDRINVRRLFLTIEATISRAARAQLFEFNDVITRSNFLNIVEPYLRDVKAKRGITDFLVVCDESNNTPTVIDANQFRADIYVKPARSINFIGLTFVANRTGISFEEVVGTV
jgi:uncharacterized protein YkvS